MSVFILCSTLMCRAQFQIVLHMKGILILICTSSKITSWCLFPNFLTGALPLRISRHRLFGMAVNLVAQYNIQLFEKTRKRLCKRQKPRDTRLVISHACSREGTCKETSNYAEDGSIST